MTSDSSTWGISLSVPLLVRLYRQRPDEALGILGSVVQQGESTLAAEYVEGLLSLEHDAMARGRIVMVAGQGMSPKQIEATFEPSDRLWAAAGSWHYQRRFGVSIHLAQRLWMALNSGRADDSYVRRRAPVRAAILALPELQPTDQLVLLTAMVGLQAPWQCSIRAVAAIQLRKLDRTPPVELLLKRLAEDADREVRQLARGEKSRYTPDWWERPELLPEHLRRHSVYETRKEAPLGREREACAKAVLAKSRNQWQSTTAVMEAVADEPVFKGRQEKGLPEFRASVYIALSRLEQRGECICRRVPQKNSGRGTCIVEWLITPKEGRLTHQNSVRRRAS